MHKEATGRTVWPKHITVATVTSRLRTLCAQDRLGAVASAEQSRQSISSLTSAQKAQVSKQIPSRQGLQATAGTASDRAYSCH